MESGAQTSKKFSEKSIQKSREVVGIYFVCNNFLSVLDSLELTTDSTTPTIRLVELWKIIIKEDIDESV